MASIINKVRTWDFLLFAGGFYTFVRIKHSYGRRALFLSG